MPLLLVGRDHAGERVLIVVVAATVPGSALLNSDLGDEGHTIELLELDRALGARLWAYVVGLETERAIEDCLERVLGDVGGLGVTVGGADEHHVRPKLAPRVLAVDDGELSVDHLAAAVLAPLEQATLAGITRANVHRDGGWRPLRDQRDR